MEEKHYDQKTFRQNTFLCGHNCPPRRSTPSKALAPDRTPDTRALLQPFAASPPKTAGKHHRPLFPMRYEGEAPSEAQGGYSVLGKLKTFPFPAFPKGRAGSPPARNPAQRRLPKSPALSERPENRLARAFPSPLSLVPRRLPGRPRVPALPSHLREARGRESCVPRAARS